MNASYPLQIEGELSPRLSRWLWLVKWLLALPHLLVLALFAGGAWASWAYGGGLIGLPVVIAAIVLLCTGRYPRTIYDFVLAMNRWAFRVTAYLALKTDAYPPFRLDLGGDEPAAPAAQSLAAAAA